MRPKENLLDWTNLPESNPKVLSSAALFALLVEFLALTFLGLQGHWLVHPPANTEQPRFIEAEVFEAPKLKHLVEPNPVRTPVHHEATLSKVPGKGKKAKEAPVEEQNKTQAGGPPLPATHGPLASYAPAPVIPDYLKDREINTSAIIDFYVTAQGGVSPKLVGSTGNEELDALAISTAKKWQFRPAEQNHKPVDSKIRLRIIFQVH